MGMGIITWLAAWIFERSLVMAEARWDIRKAALGVLRELLREHGQGYCQGYYGRQAERARLMDLFPGVQVSTLESALGWAVRELRKSGEWKDG